MPLIILPGGGVRGRGGYVKGSGTIIFENRCDGAHGGRAVWIPTTFDGGDVIVIIMMDAVNCLHANVAEDWSAEGAAQSRSTSAEPPMCLRLVTYGQKAIDNFCRKRKEHTFGDGCCGCLWTYEWGKNVDNDKKCRHQHA